MRANLPSFFSFHQANDLIRVGNKNDGGYLVSKSDVIKTDLLIGLGISDDWSFESNFTKLNDVEVVAYDASIDFKFWIKRGIIMTLKNPFNFYVIKKFLSYKKFFRGKHKLIKKFVGLNTAADSHCSFEEILKNISSKNIFFKIDVEGSEYRFLNEIIKHQDRITGLVIELHDCDIHLEKIKEFINNFQLDLVHIHANNYSPLRYSDKLPLVLELTFSRYAQNSSINYLPHKFDKPNDKFQDEIEIIIS